MVNWKGLLAKFKKKEQDPIKKAKDDLFFYGWNGGFMLGIFGLLLWADITPGVKEMIGIETYSRIAVLLMFALGVLYTSNIITPAVRLWKARKRPA